VARVTIQQAASMVGMSVRTLRRRIRDGTLPASMEHRRGRDVWMVDTGDLAGWAETVGAQVAVNGPGRMTDQGGTMPTDPAPAADVDAKVQVLQAQLDAAQAQVEALEGERDWLRAQVDRLTLMLPPPAGPDRRGWWQRLWGRDYT